MVKAKSFTAEIRVPEGRGFYCSLYDIQYMPSPTPAYAHLSACTHTRAIKGECLHARSTTDSSKWRAEVVDSAETQRCQSNWSGVNLTEDLSGTRLNFPGRVSGRVKQGSLASHSAVNRGKPLDSTLAGFITQAGFPSHTHRTGGNAHILESNGRHNIKCSSSLRKSLGKRTATSLVGP